MAAISKRGFSRPLRILFCIEVMGAYTPASIYTYVSLDRNTPSLNGEANTVEPSP